MTTRQNNKLNMYLSVKAFLSNSSDVWNGIPGFVNTVDRFHSLLVKISAELRIQETPYTGVAKDKKKIKFLLIDNLVAVAGALQSIAENNDNQDLYINMHYTPGKLKIRSTITVSSVAKLVYKSALANTAQLSQNGISATHLTELNNLIEQFDLAGPAPRAAKSSRKTATERLRLLLKETDNLLKKNLDNLMLQFIHSQRDFFLTYHNNRNIIDLGTRHRPE